MLSSKLQKDLIEAYQKVYEEKRGHAAGDSDVEKQASQLASDVRYKAKGKLKPGASDEEKKKVMIQILGASPAPSAVKAMAKAKLLGEEVVTEMSAREALNKKMKEKKVNTIIKKDAIQDVKTEKKLAKAMMEDKKMAKQSDDALAAAHKKFSSMDQSTPSNKFMLKRIEKEQKKRAKGKKIVEANKFPKVVKTNKPERNPENMALKKGQPNKGPNYNSPMGAGAASQYESVIGESKKTDAVKNFLDKKAKKLEKKRASQSQAARNNPHFDSTQPSPSGRSMGESKLDPVGQEDGDINNDGKKDSTDSYLMNRRKAVKKAIAKKRGKVKEGFSAWRIDLDFNEQVKK